VWSLGAHTGRIVSNCAFTASAIMFGADRELIDQWLWILVAIGAAVILVAVILLRRKRTNKGRLCSFDSWTDAHSTWDHTW
jgi:O-antigen/teichoic acid export membrane protein